MLSNVSASVSDGSDALLVEMVNETDDVQRSSSAMFQNELPVFIDTISEDIPHREPATIITPAEASAVVAEQFASWVNFNAGRTSSPSNMEPLQPDFEPIILLTDLLPFAQSSPRLPV